MTEALHGDHAVGDEWRARPAEAIAAIAAGLRAIHALPVDEFPADWADQVWPARQPAARSTQAAHPRSRSCCTATRAPNTLITPEGVWAGNVDAATSASRDRWADLAVASMSLDWNFGEVTRTSSSMPTASCATRSASRGTGRSGMPRAKR